MSLVKWTHYSQTEWEARVHMTIDCNLNATFFPVWIPFEQESPPAWTQEAYRPPHSKCSLCWGGYPSQVWGGTPSHVQGQGKLPRPRSRGVPHPRSGGVLHPRSGGYPIPCLWGVPHLRSGGYLIPCLGGGTWGTPPPSSRPGRGTPPTSDLRWGTLPHLDWPGYPPDLKWGTPLDLR